MVFRRPYAFLIKYFRLIHIILFILVAYITFKANSILTFFKDYINYKGSMEIISSDYINVWIFIFSILIIGISIIIFFLMRYKKKPKLFYVITSIVSVISIILFLYLYGNIKALESTSMAAREIRLLRDISRFNYWMLFIMCIPTLIRGLGFDINKFGIRELKLDIKNGFRINGKGVKLRGACVHHDNGVIGACTFEDAEERRVKRLKESGFNAIRSAHNPMSKAMLDACDRLGMLVMEETFDTWNVSKEDYDYALYFNENWEKDIEAVVGKNFNHPSVIIYCIGNEIPEAGTQRGANTGLKIVEKLSSLDNTRYTLNSVNGMFTIMDKIGKIMDEIEKEIGDEPLEKEINNFMVRLDKHMDSIVAHEEVTKATQEIYAGVDIAGYNYMTGRYGIEKEIFPNRIICGSETAPQKIDINWKYVRENPHIIGDFTWVGWDYLGEAGVGKHDYTLNRSIMFGGAYPWYIAYCGDIDIIGNRRPASYYREIVFGLRKEPYIAVHRPEYYGKEVLTTQWSWSDSIASWTWKGFEGKPIKVEVYSDADEIELILNGKSLGKEKVGEENRFKAIFDINYENGKLEAVAYENGNDPAKAFAGKNALSKTPIYYNVGFEKFEKLPEKVKTVTTETLFAIRKDVSSLTDLKQVEKVLDKKVKRLK